MRSIRSFPPRAVFRGPDAAHRATPRGRRRGPDPPAGRAGRLRSSRWAPATGRSTPRPASWSRSRRRASRPGERVTVSLDGVVRARRRRRPSPTAPSSGQVAAPVPAARTSGRSRSPSTEVDQPVEHRERLEPGRRARRCSSSRGARRRRGACASAAAGSPTATAPPSTRTTCAAGKLRKTVRLGKPRGACGTLNVRRRQIPIRRPRTGRWTLQVDNQPTYSARPESVFVASKITVRRVLRPVR